MLRCPASLALSLLLLTACGPDEATARDEDAGPQTSPAASSPRGAGAVAPHALTQLDEHPDIDTSPRGGTPGAGYRLADEDSPYLRQHADNTVEWWPWGEAAFAEARARDVPIFLSIGYSSCHWCHVMEHESFEDAAIGAELAQHFVSIKVDREQRPDVDALMMHRVRTLMRVGGGWPLTAFLTHEGDVFFGGTYFPPTERFGQPGFAELLGNITRAWDEDRDKLIASTLTNRPLLDNDRHPDAIDYDREALLAAGTAALRDGLDPVEGGRGGDDGPRFPPSLVLQFLMQRQRAGADVPLELLEVTLDAMSERGLHDHVGGGFYRYTVDPRWEIPHFEKMLYDNALLAPVFAEAAALTGHSRHARAARRALDWLMRDMRSPEGLFYSARDADSPVFDAQGRALSGGHAEEGWVYTWTQAELSAVLGEADAQRFATLCGVSAAGNFEHGRSHLIPRLSPHELADSALVDWPEDLDLGAWWDASLEKLRVARDLRPQAFRDEKQLTGWNGLALLGVARSARWLEDEALGAEAERSAEALLARLTSREESGALHVAHQLFEGRASGQGDLFDHAALALGLLETAELQGRDDLAQRALELARVLLARFGDPPGGFWLTEGNDPLVPERGRAVLDNARPAGESLAVQLFLRLAAQDNTGELRAHAERSLARSADYASRSPGSLASLLVAYDLLD